VRSVITLGAFLTIYGLTWSGKMQVDIVVRIADILLGYWFGKCRRFRFISALGHESSMTRKDLQNWGRRNEYRHC